MSYKQDQIDTRLALLPRRNEELSKPRSRRVWFRQKRVDRKMTKKGYAYGIKMDSKEEHLINHLVKRQGVQDAEV